MTAQNRSAVRSTSVDRKPSGDASAEDLPRRPIRSTLRRQRRPSPRRPPCFLLPDRGSTPDDRGTLPTTQAVIAHRGASGHAPEHTFAAYDRAISMGADYIEQDVAMTADGVLVCLHDGTLDRTARGAAADCAGSVATKTLAQLKQCDMGSWFNQAYPDRARPEFVGLLPDRYRAIVDAAGLNCPPAIR